MATIVTINASDQITNSRADINTNFANLNSDKIETSVIDTDTSMAANSDAKIPSQKAVKTYIDTSGGQNASETARGIVEEATDAEVTAGTATGATGAKLFVTPAKLATNLASLNYVDKIEIDTTEITVANTTTETTLFDVSITGGLLSTNNGIRFKIFISNWGQRAANTITLRLKYGSSTLVTTSVGGPNSDVSNFVGYLEGYILSDGSTSAQKASLTTYIHENDDEASGDTNVGIGKFHYDSFGTGTVSSASNQTLSLTLQHSAANVADTVTAESWVAELIR